jgi:hypothetical protein
MEDGRPYFANSVAKKSARLRNRMSGLLNEGNGAQPTLCLTNYDPAVSSDPPKFYPHGERLPNSSKY